MIKLENVSKFYHANEITNLGLRNINVEFNKGEIVAITGDSGCGKSTLLNVITKIDTFDEGEIYYKGNETSYFSVADMDDFRKNKIGFIFQNYNIIDSYTVLENVMLPLTLKGIDRKEAREKALELIEKVGLKGRETHRGTKLSGGEKQRTVIARALASDCEILACDEPTGNLDSQTGADIIELIKEVAKDKLVLIVTHDFEQVKHIVTRRIKLADGEIISDEVFKDVEKDENQELELDYVPLPRKTLFRVALNNIFYTPKKSILLCAILFVVSLVTLFLYQTIYVENTSYSLSNNYVNLDRNRLYAYNSNHAELDTTLFEGYDTEYNPFYEDSYVTIWYDLGSFQGYSTQAYASTHYDFDEVDEGRNVENDNEVVLILSSFYAGSYGNPGVGDYIYPFSYKQMDSELTDEVEFDYLSKYRFEIVGIVYDDNGYNRRIYGQGDLFKQCFSLNSALNNADFHLYGKKDNIETNLDISLAYRIDATRDKPTLLVPESYEQYHFDTATVTIELFDLYEYKINLEEADIVTLPDDNFDDEPMIYIPEDFKLPLYEAQVFDSNPSSAKRNLESKGLEVDICAKVSSGNALIDFVNMLSAIVSIVFASISLIIVFFITYHILAKVYQSKSKDYEILRTLGVTKSDMIHVVNHEVITLCMSIALLTYIIFVIFIYAVPTFEYFRPITFTISLIYFIGLLLFSYLLARRFNRKLFKFSVTKTLKGER